MESEIREKLKFECINFEPRELRRVLQVKITRNYDSLNISVFIKHHPVEGTVLIIMHESRKGRG